MSALALVAAGQAATNLRVPVSVFVGYGAEVIGSHVYDPDGADDLDLQMEVDEAQYRFILTLPGAVEIRKNRCIRFATEDNAVEMFFYLRGEEISVAISKNTQTILSWMFHAPEKFAAFLEGRAAINANGLKGEGRKLAKARLAKELGLDPTPWLAGL
jgi:hypothetical protein